MRGQASPVVFWNEERDISVVVHGDDFTFEGEDEDLKWILEKMKEWFELTVRGILGPEVGDDKEVVILGRIVRWEEWGVSYRADPRQRKLILEYFGLDDESKELVGTGSKEDAEEGDEEEVSKEESTEYRATAARMNFLAQDDPDIMFAVKEVCRGMSKPKRGDFKVMKRLARFILGREEVVWEFRWQEECDPEWNIFTDSDWAGCRETRRSTSGGVAMLGIHCIKYWSNTQKALSLSSAEAEFYALTEGILRGRGLRNIGREIGIWSQKDEMKVEVREGELEVFTDSSAAKGFVSKRGIGKMRHIEVRWLWVQGEVQKGRIKVNKVEGERNPADVTTKFLTLNDIERKLEIVGLKIRRRLRKRGPEEEERRTEAEERRRLKKRVGVASR